MSDNPYQSPAEILPVEPATGDADIESRRLGRGISTVFLLDSLGCAIRVYIFVTAIKIVIHHFNALILATTCLMVAITFFGFSGDILILMKKRVGIPLASIGLALGAINWGRGLWLFFQRPFHDPIEKTAIGVTIVLYPCWLVLYGCVLRLAAKKLRPHRKDNGTITHPA